MTDDMRPVSLLLALVPLSVSACATAAQEEDSANGAGAFEVAAADRSGLRPGLYATEGGLLIIESGFPRRLEATIRMDDERDNGMRVQVDGAVDVSLEGAVKITGGACEIALTVEGDEVTATPESVGVRCLSASITFVRQSLAQLEGTFSCIDWMATRSTVSLSSVTTAGALVAITEDGKKRTLNGTFGNRAKLVAQDWEAANEDERKNTFDFTRSDHFVWQRGNVIANCDRDAR